MGAPAEASVFHARGLHWASETMSRDELQALQLGRLRKTLANAHRHVAWQRERMDAALLEAWDAHDWRTWFGQQEAFAQGRIRIHIFGHALLEHMLYPERLPTAKCLVLCGGDPADWCSTLAEAIAAGKLLNDPQELRPLPLAGIPGWSAGQHAAEFFDGDAFRPRRADRCYPMPWRAATDAAVPA